MVSATCQGSVDSYGHLSRFSWWFQPLVKVQLIVMATCQGSVDSYGHLSIDSCELLWIDLVQPWYNDRYYWVLHFRAHLYDLDINSVTKLWPWFKVTECEKAKTSFPKEGMCVFVCVCTWVCVSVCFISQFVACLCVEIKSCFWCDWLMRVFAETVHLCCQHCGYFVSCSLSAHFSDCVL